MAISKLRNLEQAVQEQAVGVTSPDVSEPIGAAPTVCAESKGAPWAAIK